MSTKYDQNGMVSIMIASVLMVIMALMTLGFTRVVQNEQRQSIDSQLSEQAFYAAESGINVAVNAPGFPGVLKTDCDVSSYGGGQVSVDDEDVAFTCIQINPNPSDLVFGNDSITTSRSKVVPINTDPIATTLTIQWNDTNHDVPATANCSDVTLRDVASWDSVGALRVDLIGVPSAATFDRQSLLDSQFSAILYPCPGAGPTSISFSGARGDDDIGRIIPVQCSSAAEYECRLDITDITNGGPYRQHYIRFNSIYSDVNVRITAGTNVAGERPLFAGAQAVVDSTGRATDVYRRLQARIPLYESYITPSATIQTLDDICKLYQVEVDRIVDNCN